MSDSVQPHRWQPTRLPHPWDSPGKNTGMSCHFLLQCMKMNSESEVAQSCPTLSDPMDCRPPGSSVHGIFQARILEYIAIYFSRGSSQGSKPCFLHWKADSLPPGKPVCVCVCVCVYYSTIEKNEILQFERTWMDLEGIMLSEISQTEKHRILYDLTYMWNLKNKQKLVS